MRQLGIKLRAAPDRWKPDGRWLLRPCGLENWARGAPSSTCLQDFRAQGACAPSPNSSHAPGVVAVLLPLPQQPQLLEALQKRTSSFSQFTKSSPFRTSGWATSRSQSFHFLNCVSVFSWKCWFSSEVTFCVFHGGGYIQLISFCAFSR